jgi:signal transduction histidine kinase
MSTQSQPPVYFLLVDDLEENLLALDALLRRDGLVLLKARSGTDALEFLVRYDVALALIDVQMPGMDSFELAELMRGSERTRRMPIIFVTAGVADRERRFRGYETGAVDFLNKPIEADILRSKCDVFFELCRQRQEVAALRDELRIANETNARLLRESERQTAALVKADRQKDEFLAILTHELRNPLGPIRDAVEILGLAGKSPQLVEEAREIVSRQVSHMARLVDDLLDVARIARGQIQLRTEPTDLAAIVLQTAEDYRPTMLAAGIELGLSVPSEAISMNGDPTRLMQVVGNLLHNATKFTPRGGQVRVELNMDAEATVATVAVQDSGIGLDDAMLRRLLLPFSQAEQGLDREKGGLGLGLVLAKGLVELHGGRISAESEGRNQGATFRFSLPIERVDVTQLSAADSGTAVSESQRILIIEDNADAAWSLASLLEAWGHDVQVASNGADGLAAAGVFAPDVIISDIGLPGDHNGFAVANSVGSNPRLNRAYLIAMSGYGHEDVRKKAADAGFQAYLVKPVTPGTLQQALSAVRNVLR